MAAHLRNQRPQRLPGYSPDSLALVRKTALPALVDIFSQGLNQFELVLAQRIETGGSLQQMMLMDNIRQLRQHQQAMVKCFASCLQKSWMGLESGTPLLAESLLSQAGQSGGLSLMEETDLELLLMVREFAETVSEGHIQLLSRINHRLAHIAGIKPLEMGANPIGPAHTGLAVQEAFSLADLDTKVRQDMFALGATDFAKHISQVYESVDEQLLKLGVLPDLPTEPQIVLPKKDAGPPRPSKPQSGGGNGGGFGSGFPGVGGGSGMGAGIGPQKPADSSWEKAFSQRWQDRGGPALDSPHVVMDTLYQLLERNRAQEKIKNSSGSGSGSGSGSDDNRGASATENTSSNTDVAGPPRAQLPVPIERKERLQTLSLNEVMSVLSALQTSPAPVTRLHDSGERSLALQVKDQVLAQATRLGKDPRQVQLDLREENAIDLVGMLLDILLDSDKINDESREMISRLTVPLTKVAMLDRQMFIHKSHPARKLLNRLIHACEGRTGDTLTDKMLLGKVEKTIEKITNEFNENMAIFQASEEDLSEYMELHQRRVELAEKRAREAQIGREKLEMARARAVTELARRLTGEPLPAAFETFLHEPWSHHLSLALLREGENSTSVNQVLALADTILAEVERARNKPGKRQWLKLAEPALQKVLGSIGLFGDASKEVIEVLRDSLRAIAENRPELERPLPELPRVGLGANAASRDASNNETAEGDDKPVSSEHQEEVERFRQLPVGTRLEFIDRDGKMEVGKLSWISPISNRLLFVNPRGRRLRVVTPNELVAMQHMGRLRIHDESGAFDNAMQNLVEKLDSEPMPESMTLLEEI